MKKYILSIVTILFIGFQADAQNFHVQEDFGTLPASMPAGWTNSAVTGSTAWSFGIDGSVTNASNNNLDGTVMAYFDDDGLGAGATNNRADLLTPVFNNAGAASTTLEFDYNFREFAGPLDSFIVSVFDGTNWVEVFSTGTDDCGNYLGSCANNFPHAVIDISAYDNANCQVRFTYFDGNDWCWYVGIDNVVISSPFPNDVGVSQLVNPISSCGLSSAETVQVQVKNFGSSVATNFSVVIDTNGTIAHTETITASIPAGDSLLYTFTGTLDMVRTGFYDLKAYTIQTLDGNNDNDSTNVSVENEPNFVPTYTDNFEGLDRWKTDGTNVSWQRGAPSSANFNSVTSGVNAYVTNLNGDYNNNETSYLYSPCFNFSSANGDPILSFNLNHRTEIGYDRLTFEASTDGGVTWSTVNPGGANPTNWYTTGAPYWEGNSPGWIGVENVLTGYGSQGSVNFRFKFTSDGSGIRDGVMIDDFSVRYPQPVDISVNNINYPSTSSSPLCGLGSESIIVELENKGASAIDTVYMSYRVNGGAITTDTLIQNIPVQSLVNFIFPTKYNFTGQPSFTLDVWASVRNDGFLINDSVLNRTVINSSAATTSLPYRENFNGASWVTGNGNIGGNSLVPGPWVRVPNQTGFGNYSWRVNTFTTGFATGPASGVGGTGKFLNVFSNVGGTPTATVEGPCINLGNNAGAIMEFYTHRYGARMPDLNLDIYDGSQWILGFAQYTTQQQTSSAAPWTKQTVNLSQFAGRRIKFRFRATKSNQFGQGDIGIDDVEIFEPIPRDGKMSALVSPVSGCTPSGTIIAEIENFGTSPLTDIPVAFSIDNGNVFRDTVPGTLAPGAKVNHTFPITANFSTKGTTYSIAVWTEVLGDTNLFNDRLITDVTNETRDVSFVEDFEGFTDGNCNNVVGDVYANGWENTTTGPFTWHVQSATCPGGTGSATGSLNTGPNSDHTNGTGIFMYTEASSGAGAAQLESPCIDFKGRAGAAVKFWYHMYGATIGTLFVDVFADGVWNNGVFSIANQQQTSTAAPWREAIAKFNQFGNKDLKVRFRGVRGTSFTGDMAIDDISFFAPFGKDARMLAVTAPESGCDINGASFISVQVDNQGVEPINANSDSLLLYYQIDNLPPVRDTFNMALPSEQSATFTFTQPADLSTPGKTYLVKAWTALLGEEDVTNDTLFNHKIINGTKLTNYFENFESFRDANCDQLLGQVLQQGWAETSTSTHTWQVQSSLCGKGASTTPTSSTGPQGDRTTGSGMFMYTEADGSGTATFESPCINLTNNTNPRFSFFYHKYGGNMNNLSVDVFFNGNWVNGVGSINGQTQTSAAAVWKNLEVDLSPYAGGLVQVRFRAVKTGFGTRSDMAIDDVYLYEAIPNDAGITEVIQPTGDACGLTSGNVVVNIENFGTADILPGDLIVQYNNNGGPYVSDTIQQTISAGSNLNYTFTTPVDLSNPGKQKIYARTILANDSLPQNNFASTTVINRQPGIPRYTQDFEELVQGANNYSQDQLKGYTRLPANGGAGVFMWHVVSGAGPYIDGMPPHPVCGAPSTGPSGDHTFANNRVNGKGTYMLMETNIGQVTTSPVGAIPADAWFELPCGPMDFSTSKNGAVLLSYYYHMFGPHIGNLFVDVHNGTTWVQGIDVIRGQQQSDDTEPWVQRKVVLDRFVGLNAVKIRLRAEIGYNGNRCDGRGGDIGIDDIEILDRAQKDAAAFSLQEPSSDCALTASERFRIRIQNLGTEDILGINLGYQIIFTPHGGGPTSDTLVRDSSIGQTIVPLAFFDFSFQNIDMSKPGKYFIKYWTEYRGDEHIFNDTLTELITNTARPFPSCDDFSDLVSGHIAKDFKDGVLPNDWEANTQPYSWVATVEGEVPNLKGHTGGLNDVFMYAEDPAPYAGEARMESPCWDLNNTPAANLEFWYIMPSPGGRLEIGVAQNGGAFLPIDTIKGVEGAAREWRKYEAVLADFVGANVQVQFRAYQPGGSFYAIDDVCIIKPDPQQILFNEFANPFDGRCFYSDSERVSIRVRNIGIDRIDSFQVVLALDEDLIGGPRGRNGFRDTIWIRPGIAPPFFNPGELLTFTINDPRFILDLSAYKTYYLHAWILLKGDNDESNNLRLDYEVTHGEPELPPYVVDFENPVDPLEGGVLLGNPTQDGYDWCVTPAWTCDRRGVTGPELDHTRGPVDTTGICLQSNSAAGVLGDLIAYQSPCITLIGTQAPEMKYWYHMFGFDMGNLTLQINDDFGWVTIETLAGQDPDQRINGRTPWKSRIVDLSAYRGKVIKYRFLSSRGDAYAGNMAIDDISVYDAAAIDIAPAALNQPNTDSTQCYSANNPLSIDVINNGSDSLNFENDTVCITAIIFKDNQGDGNFVVLDTLVRCFFNNQWLNAGGIAEPLPRDSIVTLTMDSTFDMSDTGSFYRFIIIADVDGDLIKSNNQKDDIVIKSQRKVGEIVSILPNDTICFGDPVLIAVRNQFGAVTWEESRIRKDGSSAGFFLGSSTPRNRPNYIARLAGPNDSTTDIRSRVCLDLFINEGIDETTDSVRIEVLKPYKALAFGGERCANEVVDGRLVGDTLNVLVQPNITGVNYYANLTDQIPEADVKVAPFEYVLKNRLTETDTFYVETLIEYPNILPSGLFCSSTERTLVERVIHTVPTTGELPDTTTVYCGPGSGSILNQGDVFTVDPSPVDGNGIPVRQDTYSWDIVLEDDQGSLIRVIKRDTLNTQSFAVDPWRMDVTTPGTRYKISVDIDTDAGCEPDPGAVTDIYIKVLDDCTVGLQESTELGELEIFPNPVSDILTVNQSSVEIYNGSIFLLSAEGRLIESIEELTFGQLNQQIDMSKLPKGVYFIKIETDKGTTVRKVVKS